MKKNILFFRIILLSLAFILSTLLIHAENDAIKKTGGILMIIASSNFRDEELNIPKEIFRENGYKVTVASSRISIATGMLGAKVTPDLLLQDVRVADYLAVVFVGGGGAKEYYANSTALSIAKEAYNKGILVGAICIAPNILANAGILKNKKATCFDSDNLKAKGALFTGKSVERDGKIITAKGPQAAKEFGTAVVNALKE
jgi:protease I